MTTIKVLIIPGLTLPTISDAALADVRSAAGADATVVVSEYADAVNHIGDADVVLGIVPPKLFRAAGQLKWVQSISSGVDAFMYPEFINSPVTLTSEKGLVGEHLADHGFGLLLMLTRQLAAARDLGPEAWNHRPELRRQEFELTGLTMGIIGFGGTGRAMARRAHAFGMHVRALDKDPVAPGEGVDLVEPDSALADVLGASDVVAVCCPLTEATNKLINEKTLKLCRANAILINVTRGEIMDEAALVDALENGTIAGAGLDVAPREPLPSASRLWALPNVVMTPHTAGASQYRAERNLQRFVDNLGKFVRGEPLEGIIDKTQGY